MVSTRIYVGNLPPDIRSKDIEDLFYKFGKIAFIDLKTRRSPPFAFVEFYDSRDAKDAVSSRDGYDYDGYKLRVEFPRGRERGPGGVFKKDGYLSRGGGMSRSRSGGTSRRSNYRIKVVGLPPSGSWQDLKDHMREAGEVCFADVFKDGTGVVEFLRYDDMKYALKRFDDSRFRSHEGEMSYIRISEDKDYRGRRSRRSRYDDSRSRSRSRSRSPKRSRGSPTYSPARDDEDSRSDSRSRSPRSRSRSPRRSDRSHSPYSRSPSHENGEDENRKSRSTSNDDHDKHSNTRNGGRSRSRSYSDSDRSVSRSPDRRSYSDKEDSRSPGKRSYDDDEEDDYSRSRSHSRSRSKSSRE